MNLKNMALVPGFGGKYLADKSGKIYNTSLEKFEKPHFAANGYCTVNLYSDWRNRKTCLVHRQIWSAFNGPIQKGECVKHINGDKTDNRLSNLVIAGMRVNVGPIPELQDFVPVSGHEKLALINKDGRIYLIKKNRFAKHVLTQYGYYHVHIGRKIEFVHRLLALTFIPNPDNKPFINHINSNKQDFSLSNLEWCTPLENAQHCIKAGRANKFNCLTTTASKLTKEQVLEIRKFAEENKANFKSMRQIAIHLSKKYNLHEGSIQSVIVRRSWRII